MATTTDVPGRYQVALDGIGFMVDDSDGNPGIVHQSIRTQREQSVSQGNIGEATVNPEGFWRRSIDGWHHGAGQTYFDRDSSDPLRFRQSEGVEVFATKHQLTLLNATALAYSFSVDNAWGLIAGSRLYVRDGNTVKFTTAPLTTPWVLTTVTGTTTGGIAPRRMATDGANVYISYDTNGIYLTTTSTTTAASFITGTTGPVWFVKGRLLTGYGNALYNPVAAGALPAALLTLPTGWTWVDACGGPNHVYLLATNGSNTVVYKTTIQPDGTALDVPTVAGELPAGQYGVGIYSYAGKVFVGAKGGVQMADIDGDGNLILGSRIPPTFIDYPAGLTTTAFSAFEADDRFVYYSDRFELGVGISRMDLTVETAPNTPAYATDLRYFEGASEGDPQVADVHAIMTWQDKRIFVTYNKAFVETSEPVLTGYLDSGLIALDLADRKTAVSMDVEAAIPGDSGVIEYLSYDRGATFDEVGTREAGDEDEFPIVAAEPSRQFEIRAELFAGNDDDQPVLYRHTLKVEPNVAQGVYVILRLRLFENEVGFGGQHVSRTSVATARAQLEAWQASREVIVLQEGSTNYNVTVRDIEWQSDNPAGPTRDGEYNGVATVRCKVVSDA